MIALYEKWRDKADTTGWGLDISNQNQVGDNTYGKTIREDLILKCSFYYEFEEIIGDSPTISPPFWMESGHLNREAEVREEFFHKDTMCDLNTQQYEYWINEDKRVDNQKKKNLGNLRPGLEKNHGLLCLLKRIFYLCSLVEVLEIKPLQLPTTKILMMI